MRHVEKMEEMTSTYTTAMLNLNPGVFLSSIIPNNLDGRLHAGQATRPVDCCEDERTCFYGKTLACVSRILSVGWHGDGSKLSTKRQRTQK